jgi:hypothetical protein
MRFTFEDVLGWSEVMKNYSAEMVFLILNMDCSWKNKDKSKKYFYDMQASMLTYTPIKMYKNSDLNENKQRWHQLLKVLS